MDFFNPAVIFLIVISDSINESKSDFSNNLRFLDTINWVSSSAIDPKAIERNCENSFVDVLAAPSAMFDGTETAHLLI